MMKLFRQRVLLQQVDTSEEASKQPRRNSKVSSIRPKKIQNDLEIWKKTSSPTPAGKTSSSETARQNSIIAPKPIALKSPPSFLPVSYMKKVEHTYVEDSPMEIVNSPSSVGSPKFSVEIESLEDQVENSNVDEFSATNSGTLRPNIFRLSGSAADQDEVELTLEEKSLKRVSFAPEIDDRKRSMRSSFLLMSLMSPMSMTSPSNASSSSTSSKNSTISSSSSATASSRGILRTKNQNAREMENFLRRQQELAILFARMRKGVWVTKWGGSGKAEKRFMYVNRDGSELRWAHSEVNCKLEYRRVPLADVKSVVFGPRTPKFLKYDWINGKPYNCMSIILENHERTTTVDFECANREEFMNMFLGIQSLAPLSHKFLSRSKLNWYRSLYKTVQIAKKEKCTVPEVWRRLVFLAAHEDHWEKALNVCCIDRMHFRRYEVEDLPNKY